MASRAARMVGLFLLFSRTSITSLTLHFERRDVDFAAVHQQMAVADELARLAAAGSEAHAIDHVVQPPLERVQHVFAGDALRAASAFSNRLRNWPSRSRNSGEPSAFRATGDRSRPSSVCDPCRAGRERSCASRWRTSRCGSARPSGITSCPRAGTAGKRGHCILPIRFFTFPTF